jgi:bifunctional DNase/RNase
MARVGLPCAVVGVAYDDSDDVPLVLLQETQGGRVFHIPVGAFEAGSIILAIRGLDASEPQAHDLLTQLFHRHGFRMEYFLLGGNAEAGYSGSLRYRGLWRRRSMPVRPSDGIALALRMGAPILADLSMDGCPDRGFPDIDRFGRVLLADPYSRLRYPSIPSLKGISLVPGNVY